MIERPTGPHMLAYPNDGEGQRDFFENGDLSMIGKPAHISAPPRMRKAPFSPLSEMMNPPHNNNKHREIPTISLMTPPGISPLYPSFLEIRQRIRSRVVSGDLTPRSDIWEYNIKTRTWSQPAYKKDETQPEPRWMHTAVVDKAFGKMTVFGGCSNTFQVLQDVWEYSVDTGAWKELWPKTTKVNPKTDPKAREGHSAVMSANDGMIVFGGITQTHEVLGDLYEFKSASWKFYEPKPVKKSLGDVPQVATAPPPRWLHTMVRLPKDIYILFGGLGADSSPLDDTWSLEISDTMPKWTLLNGYKVSDPAKPPGISTFFPPPARYLHSAVAFVSSAKTSQMYVHGGCVNNMYLDDMWMFDYEDNSWTQFHYDSDFPMARAGHSMILLQSQEARDEAEKAITETTSKKIQEKEIERGPRDQEEFLDQPTKGSVGNPPIASVEPGSKNAYFLIFGGKSERGGALSASSGTALY